MKKKPIKFTEIDPDRDTPVNLFNTEFKIKKKESYPKSLIKTLKMPRRITKDNQSISKIKQENNHKKPLKNH